MFLSTINLFEQLVEGKAITLKLDSKEIAVSLHAQLRTYKSRHNRSFLALFGERLTAKDVIISLTWDSELNQATFTLTESKKKKLQWQVVETELQRDITNLSGS